MREVQVLNGEPEPEFFAYLASDGNYYLSSVYGIIRSPSTDLLHWEEVYGGQFLQMIGTGKNMEATRTFARELPGVWDELLQRLAREAMFLLVWSCPNPVIDCTVGLLAEG